MQHALCSPCCAPWDRTPPRGVGVLLTCSKAECRPTLPLITLCVSLHHTSRTEKSTIHFHTYKYKKVLKVNKTELLKFVKKCTSNLPAKNQIRSTYGRLRCSPASKAWGTRGSTGVMKAAYNLKKRGRHHTSHMWPSNRPGRGELRDTYLYSKV